MRYKIIFLLGITSRSAHTPHSIGRARWVLIDVDGCVVIGGYVEWNSEQPEPEKKLQVHINRFKSF